MKPIPDSEIARNAESMLRATSQAALVNHCLRSYMWGAALAEIENITFDAELLFVSAALHDLGLLEQFDSGAPFEHDSASEARQFTSSHGWSPDKTSTAGQVIVLHVAPDVTLDNGAEAYLLWQATAVDVTGSRLDLLSASTISQVLSTYPRLDFVDHFGGLFADQASRKPDTRAGQHVQAGLLERLATCALNGGSPVHEPATGTSIRRRSTASRDSSHD